MFFFGVVCRRYIRNVGTVHKTLVFTVRATRSSSLTYKYLSVCYKQDRLLSFSLHKVRPKRRNGPKDTRIYSQSDETFKSHVQIFVCLLQTGPFVITLTARGTSTSLGLWGRNEGGVGNNPHVLPGNSWRNQTAFKVFSTS